MSTAEEIDDQPVADVQSERRWGLLAGALGLFSVIATIASVPVAATDVAQTVGDPNDLTLLISIGNSGSGQFSAMVLRLLAVACLIPFALFAYKATKGRNPEHPSYIPIIGIVAFCVVGGATAVGFFEVREVARDFVASGAQTRARAETVLDDARGEGLLRAANVFQLIGGVLFGIWISLSSMEAARVGLLTRFLGIFGIGAGVTTAIGFPVASALFLAWLGSFAILAVGYWPGGRPETWETGRAFSWSEADSNERMRRRGGEPA